MSDPAAMDEALEHDEAWTDAGVQLTLQQPESVRNFRAGVWLFGLIGLALASIPVAFTMLFVPAAEPYLAVSALFVPLVLLWAVLPPLVIARLNRGLRVAIEQGVLTVGETTYDRGSIRRVSVLDGFIEVEPRDGPVERSGPVQPVNPARFERLIDSVEVSDDEADAARRAKREAMRRLRPLQEKRSG